MNKFLFNSLFLESEQLISVVNSQIFFLKIIRSDNSIDRCTSSYMVEFCTLYVASGYFQILENAQPHLDELLHPPPLIPTGQITPKIYYK